MPCTSILCFFISLSRFWLSKIGLQYSRYAEELLKQFVKGCATFYGSSFVSYNVHVLIHLARDVENYGNLDKFSCIPFENQNQLIKNEVRPGPRVLQQAVRRVLEREINLLSEPPPIIRLPFVTLNHLHFLGPTIPDFFQRNSTVLQNS